MRVLSAVLAVKTMHRRRRKVIPLPRRRRFTKPPKPTLVRDAKAPRPLAEAEGPVGPSVPQLRVASEWRSWRYAYWNYRREAKQAQTLVGDEARAKEERLQMLFRHLMLQRRAYDRALADLQVGAMQHTLRVPPAWPRGCILWDAADYRVKMYTDGHEQTWTLWGWTRRAREGGLWERTTDTPVPCTHWVRVPFLEGRHVLVGKKP